MVAPVFRFSEVPYVSASLPLRSAARFSVTASFNSDRVHPFACECGSLTQMESIIKKACLSHPDARDKLLLLRKDSVRVYAVLRYVDGPQNSA